ncbi:MAG: hypothetical protein ACO1OB_21200 [Archangium sp.]
MNLEIFCEGDTDKPVARKVAQASGFHVTGVFSLGGYDRVDGLARRLSANPPSKATLLLRDVDPTPPNLKGLRFKQCAPAVLTQLDLPNRGPRFRFRLARHEMEAWLLADATAFSRWLGCPKALVPVTPDELMKPSRTIVELASHKNAKPHLRDQLVPQRGHTTKFGPGYEAAIIQFASGPWTVEGARRRSDSLERCLRALETFRKNPNV